MQSCAIYAWRYLLREKLRVKLLCAFAPVPYLDAEVSTTLLTTEWTQIRHEREKTDVCIACRWDHEMNLLSDLYEIT